MIKHVIIAHDFTPKHKVKRGYEYSPQWCSNNLVRWKRIEIRSRIMLAALGFERM